LIDAHRRLAAACALLLLTAACGVEGPADAGPAAAAPPDIDLLVSDNGLTLNGLSANGLSANGLSANGLSANGLSSATLGTTTFRTWFNADPVQANAVMRYLVLCAAPATRTVTWKNPVSGITYSWPGSIGVAPRYASGYAPSVLEQQLITGCVLAHVNKFGRAVNITVQGRTATGAYIPWTSSEIATYANIEGAFFGNLFDPAGALYACSDKMAQVPRSYSSLRVCSWNYWPSQPGDGCPPIVQLGACSPACAMDTATWLSFKTCTVGGKTYQPITTTVRHGDWAVCGDGVCQETERCGTGTDYTSCADCGPCR